MTEPKFKIGDWVKITQQVRHFNEILKPLIGRTNKDYVSMGEAQYAEKSPISFQVIEILTQTCYAGTQIHYCLRAVNTDGVLKYTEIELELANERNEV